jgi:hypothetical protein
VFLKTWRFLTLLLAALALTAESAHVLELPQKMAYDAAMYAAVNGSLYRWFAIVGGTWQVGSIAMALVLAWLVRGGGRHSAGPWPGRWGCWPASGCGCPWSRP